MKTKVKNKKLKNKSQESEFFDDCLICQAMKQGKASTEEELKKLFKLANKKPK